MKCICCLIIAAVFFQPLVSEDILEPSVLNEVEHAISRAPNISTNSVSKLLFAVKSDIFKTNGLTKTEIAIKLVSSQKSDCRWFKGTNDVTFVALEILKSL